MQYLVGLKYFQEEPIFSPELFVAVRKRIDKDFFNDIMLSMHRKQVKETEDSNKEDDSTGGSYAAGSQQTTHNDKMKIDATCTDAEVRYPMDINILEDCSRVIDRLTKKLSAKATVASPRTHRGEARSCFVHYIKKKQKGTKLIRDTKKFLLHLLSKDIQRLTNFIGKLSTTVLGCLLSERFMSSRSICSTTTSAPVSNVSSASSSPMYVPSLEAKPAVEQNMAQR